MGRRLGMTTVKRAVLDFADSLNIPMERSRDSSVTGENINTPSESSFQVRRDDFGFGNSGNSDIVSFSVISVDTFPSASTPLTATPASNSSPASTVVTTLDSRGDSGPSGSPSTPGSSGIFSNCSSNIARAVHYMVLAEKTHTENVFA
ncbi:hypothetical protein PHLCEN_2v10168 [Hermanssonia centrifuga]|uniref:Uncharacterized protein n=1 Tax=Hermanssonia centrifuga TaxID=98765 RepID=A0A2R6NNP2_9APHY|nr:hypothetical protein PHLCEN_2v10168 [Hermanssonia centrifuga]